MSSFMDKVWTFLGLSGPLDEAGEGYEPSPFSRLVAVPSKTDYVRIEFDKKYAGNKKRWTEGDRPLR